MEIIDSKIVPNFKDLVINDQKKDKIYVPNNILKRYGKSWFYGRMLEYNKEAYFYKFDNELNELIGSYLSRKLKLDTVDYKLGNKSGFIFVMSKILYEEEYDYFFAYQHPDIITNEEKINMDENFYIDHINTLNNNLKIKILKLIAIDLKMGQYDRSNHNLMFKQNKKTKEIDLAPIYDYSNAYKTDNTIKYYENPFILLQKNKASIIRLINKYPEFLYYAQILSEINIEDIFKDIEQNNGIKLHNYEKDYRVELDKEYTKLLRII